MHHFGRSVLRSASIGVALLLVHGTQGTHASGAEVQARAEDTVAEASFLLGTWQRPDGGYVLVVEELGEDGQVRAFYYNPSPIHVAEARFARVEGQLRISVELRDTNYPGSRYDLVYDPAEDRLDGTYFQAMARETYEVRFERVRR